MPNAGRFPVAVGSYGAAEPRHGARARPVPRREQGGPPDFSENFQEEEAGGPQGAKATGHRQWLGAPQTAPDQARPQLRRLRHPGPAQAERDGADRARPADARVQSARWPGGRRLLGENPRCGRWRPARETTAREGTRTPRSCRSDRQTRALARHRGALRLTPPPSLSPPPSPSLPTRRNSPWTCAHLFRPSETTSRTRLR